IASKRACFGAQYLPTAPAGTRTTSPACASTVTPPDSTNSWPSITKLYSVCGCSSVHDSAVSSHSNNAGSDQPPCTGGTMTRHFGLSCPLKSVRKNLVGALEILAIVLFPQVMPAHPSWHRFKYEYGGFLIADRLGCHIKAPEAGYK